MDLLPFDEYVASLDRKRMSAGALFRCPAGRALLIEPSYKPHWDIPGGAVEAGEAPWTCAVREVREEIGLDRPMTRPLVIDYVTDDGRMPEGVAYIFDGGTITAEQVAGLSLTDPEVLNAKLCTTDEVNNLVKPVLARRIEVALHAAESATVVLCEDGTPIDG